MIHGYKIAMILRENCAQSLLVGTTKNKTRLNVQDEEGEVFFINVVMPGERFVQYEIWIKENW